MKELIERLEARIPDDAPKPWVLGILAWIVVAMLMPFAALLIYLEWRGAYLVLFWVMFALVLWFMGCGAVVYGRVLMGRRSTWR